MPTMRARAEVVFSIVIWRDMAPYIVVLQRIYSSWEVLGIAAHCDYMFGITRCD